MTFNRNSFPTVKFFPKTMNFSFFFPKIKFWGFVANFIRQFIKRNSLFPRIFCVCHVGILWNKVENSWPLNSIFYVCLDSHKIKSLGKHCLILMNFLSEDPRLFNEL